MRPRPDPLEPLREPALPGDPGDPGHFTAGAAPPEDGAAHAPWRPSAAQRRIEPLLEALAPAPQPGWRARLGAWLSRALRRAP